MNDLNRRSGINTIILTLLLIPHFGMAQSNNSEQEIRKILGTQAAAWNAGDIPGFMETYWKSDKLIFLGAQGPTYGWAETLERYQNAYPDKQAMGNLTFDVLRVDKRSKKVFSVVGKFMLDRDGLENLEGFFILLVEKIKGQWLIVADSTH